MQYHFSPIDLLMQSQDNDLGGRAGRPGSGTWGRTQGREVRTGWCRPVPQEGTARAWSRARQVWCSVAVGSAALRPDTHSAQHSTREGGRGVEPGGCGVGLIRRKLLAIGCSPKLAARAANCRPQPYKGLCRVAPHSRKGGEWAGGVVN